MSLDEARLLMKKCQRGFPRHMIDESNNLHAQCYGTIGALIHEVEELRHFKAAALTLTTAQSVELAMSKMP
jgi:hypothetical protein